MIIYNVNKEKGVIVARFEGGRDYWEESLQDMVNNITSKSWMSVPYYIVTNAMKNVEDFTGRAILNPEDEWDEEYGKNLAKKRLLYKFNCVKINVLSKMKQFVTQEYDNTIARIDKKLFRGI